MMEQVQRFKGSRTEKFPGYYVSPLIKSMLNKAKELVTKKDWDRVYLIDGQEGSGKSLLALQLGYYLDPTLTLDRVVFTGTDFGKAIDEAQKHECIIFDEAFNGLSSTAALSKMNKFLVRKLMECRQKNLYLIIVLPTIFLLQRYAAVFRSRVLFHVYATKAGNRGYYRMYNGANKKILFLTGAKMYSYSKPFLKTRHRFRGVYPLDEDEYRKKKLESLTKEDEEKKLDRHALKFALLAKLLKEKYHMPFLHQEAYLKEHNQPIDKSNITRLIQRIPI